MADNRSALLCHQGVCADLRAWAQASNGSVFCPTVSKQIEQMQEADFKAQGWRGG